MNDVFTWAVTGVMYKLLLLPLVAVPYVCYLILTGGSRKKAPERPSEKDRPAN
jgi:hypothetical protein